MPLVENGRVHRGDVVIETVVKEYLTPLKDAGVDTLILGCTHYPLLEEVIGDFMGPDVTLIDSGAEAANLASTQFDPNEGTGTTQYRSEGRSGGEGCKKALSVGAMRKGGRSRRIFIRLSCIAFCAERRCRRRTGNLN